MIRIYFGMDYAKNSYIIKFISEKNSSFSFVMSNDYKPEFSVDNEQIKDLKKWLNENYPDL